MIQIPETQIRSSFVNASRREASQITLPDDFTERDWSQLDFLGWRDPKIARRAYAVIPDGSGGVRGVLLQRAEARTRTRPQCSWCQDVRLPNDVVFYAAKRAGAAGKRGSTVAIYACEDFECSYNVRKDPPLPYDGYDVAAARDQRIMTLEERVRGFLKEVMVTE